jgi:IS30 family transposase
MLVDYLIRHEWSPDQIAKTLADKDYLHISHESIYRHIIRDKKTGGTLYTHCRIMPKRRRKRYKSVDFRGVMKGKRHISERPACINDRSEMGHYEGDTVIGKDRKHCILTLVERKTGYTIIRKLNARSKEEVNQQIIHVINNEHIPVKSITFDNGTEFHDFELLEKQLGIQCYFATPYHSWERGTNENTNGLIRQYLPKGTCMKHLNQQQCNHIAHKLNNRPRKRLLYKSPKEVFYAS